MENLTVETRLYAPFPDAIVLKLRGFLYARTIPQMQEAVQGALSQQRKLLVLDLSDTHYVSSGGWGAFLAAAKSARETGGDLLLAGMKAEVYDAFELLEYDKSIRFFATVEKALSEGSLRARPA